MIQQKDDKIMPQTTIAMFENQNIRRERYNDERWFSVVDIVSVLSQSSDGRKYRNKLKQRLKEE
jgi:prophage antirepressor-like protein